MPTEESPDWLVRLYDEQGATLHRLVVLLGAEEQSGRIVRSALLALHRRGHRLIDPVERVEFLQEHVVHLARAVRSTHPHRELPAIEEPRQEEILRVIAKLPARMSELIIVSHYLAVFGPELAGIMRMSVRGCNLRLEVALETLRARVGDPSPGSQPGVVESLSQEVTAALRASARQVQAPGTETLEAELQQIGDERHRSVSPRLVLVLTAVAVVLGLMLAALTRPEVAPAGSPDPSVSPTPTSVASRSLPAQVRGIPVYYVVEQDGKLHRELRDLPSTGDLVRSALDAVLTLAPLDPDYTSEWGPGQLLGAEIEGDTLTVNLSREAYDDVTTPADVERARNQMIYTVTDLVANPELRVKFLADGGPPPEGFVSATGFQREALAPLAEVSITSPKNLAQLQAGQAVITGAVKPGVGVPTVSITDTSTGAVVYEMTAQTSTGVNQEGWRVWSVTVTLEPGSYDVRATVRFGNPAVTSTENKSIKVA